MRSRSFHTDLESYENEAESVIQSLEADRKNYSRERSARSTRRRTARTATAKVPLGMSGRRNRRWAW